MINLKYLKEITENNTDFIIELKDIVNTAELKIALSILEFFNGGKYVDERDIIQYDNHLFGIMKGRYPNITKED